MADTTTSTAPTATGTYTNVIDNYTLKHPEIIALYQKYQAAIAQAQAAIEKLPSKDTQKKDRKLIDARRKLDVQRFITVDQNFDGITAEQKPTTLAGLQQHIDEVWKGLYGINPPQKAAEHPAPTAKPPTTPAPTPPPAASATPAAPSPEEIAFNNTISRNDPWIKEHVDEAADAIANAPKTIGNVASSLMKGAGDAGKGIGGAVGGLDFGGILGLLLGGIGAWMAGSAFGGGGWMSIILSIGLALLFVPMGSKLGKDYISPMLNGGKSGNKSPGASPDVTPQLGMSSSAPAAGQAMASAQNYGAQQVYDAGMAQLSPANRFAYGQVYCSQLCGFAPCNAPYAYGPPPLMNYGAPLSVGGFISFSSGGHHRR